MANQSWISIQLRFQGPLHLSKGKENNYDSSNTILHSDTLKSAMFAELKKVLGDQLEASFLDAFRISSGFPYLEKGGKTIFFLPRPLKRNLDIHIGDLSQSRQNKKLKGVQYISSDLFKKLFQAGETTDLKLENFAKNGKFVALETIDSDPIMLTDTRQHVYIPKELRTENTKEEDVDKGTTFYVDQLWFQEGAGLYFLADISQADSKTIQYIEYALELLADAGIGTDKNNGYGHFDFDTSRDIQNFDGVQFSEAAHQMCLSLYCPQASEIQDLEGSAYDLVKRGGYIASPADVRHIKKRKGSVYMFREGSIFPHQAARIGNLVDLKPKATSDGKETVAIGHPIWRDGRALFLPITLKS